MQDFWQVCLWKLPYQQGADLYVHMCATRWEYSDGSSLGEGNHWGEVGTYGGGGYYQDLSRGRDKSAHQLQVLKNNLWLDRGTRAVLLDFSVYNGNINLFCIVRYSV